ncbi:hypothetical protein RRG08_047710 [Elysia crispata]|uniref:Uncharacterized protein n=1 Tax=Elysia crispata TaxID=231223 RepID=A0AAE0ZMW6_9GAST|nr:hypothetical protein RRG08_047710 [Elysia crispata]
MSKLYCSPERSGVKPSRGGQLSERIEIIRPGRLHSTVSGVKPSRGANLRKDWRYLIRTATLLQDLFVKPGTPRLETVRPGVLVCRYKSQHGLLSTHAARAGERNWRRLLWAG